MASFVVDVVSNDSSDLSSSCSSSGSSPSQAPSPLLRTRWEDGWGRGGAAVVVVAGDGGLGRYLQPTDAEACCCSGLLLPLLPSRARARHPAWRGLDGHREVELALQGTPGRRRITARATAAQHLRRLSSTRRTLEGERGSPRGGGGRRHLRPRRRRAAGRRGRHHCHSRVAHPMRQRVVRSRASPSHRRRLRCCCRCRFSRLRSCHRRHHHPCGRGSLPC